MSFTFDVPNPTPVSTSTVIPKYIALDRDKMLYHRTELKSVDDNIVIYLKPTEPDISYEVYFRSGQFPTASSFDFRTSIDFRNDASLRRRSVTCPAGVLPSNGTIYVALKPVKVGKFPAHTHWLVNLRTFFNFGKNTAT